MTFEELMKIQDEQEQIAKTYEIFHEEKRLNWCQAARVEFFTTVHYIEKYLKPGHRILDIGAGAGEYSLYFAQKGYEVSALELAENNVRAFEKRIRPEMSVNLRQGNAMDLSAYGDESFDVVLLMGPLYHLHQEADRQQCIQEAKRVCRKDGTIFFAFIENDMVILTEFMGSPEFFSGDTYDHDSFKVVDFPFVFLTLSQCRKILKDGGVRVLHEVASDGVSELMQKQINALDEKGFSQYLKYHFYCCEKPEMLGRSNHLLFVGQK